jgi:flavin-binding protein dodecin
MSLRSSGLQTLQAQITEAAMHDHVYKVIELVGSSETSIEDAIATALSRAGETLRNLRWFEVVQTRGQLENGKVRYYQVTLKVGFTMEDAD